MNSFINLLLLAISLPTLLLSVFVGFDLPIDFLHTTGKRLPFRMEIYLVLGLLLLIIGLRRSIRRWMGVSMVKQQTKFIWNQPISTERKKRVFVYNSLEALVFLSLMLAHLFLSQVAFFVVAAYLILALDAVLFLLINGKEFRVGLSSKAILVADREIVLIYLNGLRKVSVSQQTIYFDYIEALEGQIDRDRVLFQHTK
jgi:hypothetical protein